MTPAESKIHDTLHHGTADQVLALSCPRSVGPLRVEYWETKGGSHMRITGTQSDFIIRMSGRLQRPSWVDVLGTDLVTRPRIAEPGAHRMRRWRAAIGELFRWARQCTCWVWPLFPVLFCVTVWLLYSIAEWAAVADPAPGPVSSPQSTVTSPVVRYHQLFARAVLTTVSTEVAVLFLVVRFGLKLNGPRLSTGLLLFAGVFASAGTLPWLWFVLPVIFPTYGVYVVVGEVLVWAAEALFYLVVLRLGWKQAAILSLACNVASLGIGLLLK